MRLSRASACSSWDAGSASSRSRAALAGAEVTATDYYDDALLFAALNVADATGRTIATRMVNWVEMPRGPRPVRRRARVGRALRASLRRARRRTRSPATLVRGGEAIVADPGRIALQEFLDECDGSAASCTSGDPQAVSSTARSGRR